MITSACIIAFLIAYFWLTWPRDHYESYWPKDENGDDL